MISALTTGYLLCRHAAYLVERAASHARAATSSRCRRSQCTGNETSLATRWRGCAGRGVPLAHHARTALWLVQPRCTELELEPRELEPRESSFITSVWNDV